MKHSYSRMILESDLDSFGHVNNAKYLQIFEEARWDFIANKGYGLNKIHSSKVGPVILRVELDFLKELKLREKITINTQFLGYDKKVMKVHQTITNSSNKLSAEAKFSIGLFDLTQRKLVSPTKDWLALFNG